VSGLRIATFHSFRPVQTAEGETCKITLDWEKDIDRTPPLLRNGGWKGLRLTATNSTSTPLANTARRMATSQTRRPAPLRRQHQRRNAGLRRQRGNVVEGHKFASKNPTPSHGPLAILDA
jgi:hypothetical protein